MTAVEATRPKRPSHRLGTSVVAALVALAGSLVDHTSAAATVPCLSDGQLNDACPVWASGSYQEPEGLGGVDMLMGAEFPFLPRETVASPDGLTVFAVATATDGLYQCTVNGQTTKVSGFDIATLAYSTTDGSVRWSTLQKGFGASTVVEGTAISVSPDGEQVFVAGLAARPCGAARSVTVAYAASNGQQQWAALGPLESAIIATAVSKDGRSLYTTGWVRALDSGGASASAVVEAVDTATGRQLWRSVDTDSQWTSGQAIGISADDQSVVVAEDVHSVAAVNGQSDNLLTVADKVVMLGANTGDRDWADVESLRGAGSVTDVAIAPDSSAVYTLACDVVVATGASAISTHAYAGTSGRALWHASYTDTQQSACPDGGGDLALSPDGSTLFVSGAESGGLDVLAYETARGAARWQTVVDQSLAASGDESPDNGAIIALSPDGSTAYVVGQEIGAASCNGCRPPSLTTAALRTETGQLRWTAHYGSPSVINEGVGLAVAPESGRVVVLSNETQCAPNVGATATGWAVAAVAYDPMDGPPPMPALGSPSEDETSACAGAVIDKLGLVPPTPAA